MNKLESKFSKEDVNIFESKISFKDFLRVDKLCLKHKLYNGEWSDPICRELLVRTAAVGVLLFDPIRDEIVMIRQFRVGAMNEKSSPWPLELVAGMAEQDELLESVAIRETKEESNCEITKLIRICEYLNSPGISDEKVTLFCGKINSDKAEGIFGLSEENEDIEVVRLTYSEALAAIESGHINNAMSIIALQWLALKKEEVLFAWQ